MHEKQIDPPTKSRLDDAMALLDSRSRHVMELWLEGESHQEIVSWFSVNWNREGKA